MSYCSSCGKKLKKDADVCMKCGKMVKRSGGKKDTVIAALASLIIPGAGQIYCGRVGRGIAILMGTVIFFSLSMELVTSLFFGGFFLFFFSMIFFWIWNIYDAYKIAKGDK